MLDLGQLPTDDRSVRNTGRNALQRPSWLDFENRYALNASDLSIFLIFIAMVLLRGVGEMLFAIFCVLGLLFAAIRSYRARGLAWLSLAERRVLTPIVLAMWAFFALKALSLLWSSNPHSGLQDLGTHVYFLLFPFAYLWFARAKQPQRMAYWGVVLALCGAALWALRFLGQGHTPADRFLAHTGNALVLGLLLNFYVLALLTRAFSNRDSSVPPSAWLAIGAALLVFYANHSRAAWLNLAFLALVATVIWVWGHGRMKVFKPVFKPSFKPSFKLGLKLILGLTLLAGLAWFIVQWPLMQAMLIAWAEWQSARQGAQEASSLGLRYTMYHGAWQAFWQAPWFGVGAGSVQAAVAPLTTQPIAVAKFSHVHNQFLQIMVELGALGLAVYLVFLSTLARTAWLAWRTAQTRAAGLLVAGLASLAVLNGLSNIVFKQGLQAAAFMTLLALACKQIADQIADQIASLIAHQNADAGHSSQPLPPSSAPNSSQNTQGLRHV